MMPSSRFHVRPNLADYDSFFNQASAKLHKFAVRSSLFGLWTDENHRRRLGLDSWKKGQGCDVICWGRGEPDQIAATKYGGAPAWPVGEAFPPDLKFVIQINFADSLDLFPGISLPGKLLSLWLPEENPLWGEEFTYFWLDPSECVRDPAAVTVFHHPETRKDPFYGVLHRSSDFLPEDWWELYPEGEGAEIEESWNATKIGGVSCSGCWEEEGVFLGRFTSANCGPTSVAYPWHNHPSPKDSTDSEDYLIIGDDFGVSFFLRNDGRLDFVPECND